MLILQIKVWVTSFSHNTFSYVNLSPLLVSSNVPGFSINPNITDYTKLNKKFSGLPNFLAKLRCWPPTSTYNF
jgi:hypothetical protein